jgi:hypothetical protein
VDTVLGADDAAIASITAMQLLVSVERAGGAHRQARAVHVEALLSGLPIEAYNLGAARVRAPLVEQPDTDLHHSDPFRIGVQQRGPRLAVGRGGRSQDAVEPVVDGLVAGLGGHGSAVVLGALGLGELVELLFAAQPLVDLGSLPTGGHD